MLTNWNIHQEVTLTLPPDDNINQPNNAHLVLLGINRSYSPIDGSLPVFTFADNDDDIYLITQGVSIIEENNTYSLSIGLSKPPDSDTTFNVVLNTQQDERVGSLSTTALTFTTDVLQTITLPTTQTICEQEEATYISISIYQTSGVHVIGGITHVFILQSPQFAGGRGIISNPFLVANVSHLNNIRYCLTSHYKLIQDIDLLPLIDTNQNGRIDTTTTTIREQSVTILDTSKDTSWTPLGDSTTAFSGSFDGNGFMVKNVNVNISGSGNQYAGLFGNVVGGTIKNLGVEVGGIYV